MTAEIRLSRAETLDLFAKMKNGDKSARHQIITSFLWIAEKAPHRLLVIRGGKAFTVRRYVPPSVPFDDLHQAAAIGLIKAVDRYDVESGKNFVSYAWIGADRACRDFIERWMSNRKKEEGVASGLEIFQDDDEGIDWSMEECRNALQAVLSDIPDCFRQRVVSLSMGDSLCPTLKANLFHYLRQKLGIKISSKCQWCKKPLPNARARSCGRGTDCYRRERRLKRLVSKRIRPVAFLFKSEQDGRGE
jgi:RNA polymerase sigma factor (sigma-70 family)